MNLSPLPPTAPQYLVEMRAALLELLNPTQPAPVAAYLSTNLPPPATCINGVARATDLDILVVSNGTDWIRQDTGAAI